MSDFLMSGAVLLGLVVGVLMTWFVIRGRTHSLVEAAVARAEAAAQSELAQLRERARASDETKQADRLAQDALKLEAASLRNKLDDERDETAKLTERVTRVPVLEQDNTRLAEELKQTSAELLSISSSSAQKGQAITSLTDQVGTLETANQALMANLLHANEALVIAAERKATLEEQTLRIPELERNLASATAHIDKLGNQLTELREAAGVETARLAAERSAHGLVRDELAQVKLALESAEALIGSLNIQLTELREAAGAETARLAAERSAHGLVRDELAQVKLALDSAEALVGSLNIQFTELREAAGAETARLVAERSAHGLIRDELAQVELALESAEALVGGLNIQLTELREATGAETARLVAERSAHGLVRDELAQVKLALESAEALVGSLNTQLTALREANGAETARLMAERETLGLVREELTKEKSARELADAHVNRLSDELTEMRTRLDVERNGAAEKLALLMNAKEALTDQFRSLASDILEEKSKRFAEQNQATLGQLLDPLRTQLTEFKGKVEEVYVQEGKDRTALSEQVRQLVSLNQALSQDAKNLTLALKGSAKTQGNWGELVLERVLEASGLRKGHEYHVQESQQREDGTRAQADVVINLPEERRLVVDAKVSLIAYEAHITAETDEERAQAVRRHLESVKAHIKGLSSKQYQTLYGLKSLDFVLMFIPIEPAFMMAVTHDNDLFMEAWDKNVLMVSPSTLLFVVRTVAHLWRQEQQSRNSQDIAKRGAELYDRLVGFVEDLQAVGNRLNQAQTAYDGAFKKLTSNKGNVIRQAEMLRELGVKPSKPMPTAVLDKMALEDVFDTEEHFSVLTANNTPQLPDPARSSLAPERLL
jgi:DNA recombination protein RmuC